MEEFARSNASRDASIGSKWSILQQFAVSFNSQDADTAVGFGAVLSDMAEETRHERVRKLLRLLDATWEKIVTMQTKQKYLSLESAKRFVSLAELVEYELDHQQKFMTSHVLLPDGPSENETTL